MSSRRWFASAVLLAGLVIAGCVFGGGPMQISPSVSPVGGPDAPNQEPEAGPLAKLEKSLLFQPMKFPHGNWRPTGLAFEDAWFRADDGVRLHGWYVAHPSPRAVVLYCHGNAGNLTHRAEVLRILNRELRVSVMIFDYRGYGRSEGEPSEAGILADARAARAWVARRAQVAEKEIVLLGRSLGGGVAVDLAAADGARGLILESTFSSMPDVARAHYRWLPARILMQTRLNSAAKIGDYHGPLLQSHGDADTVIPYKLGRRLHEAANEPKQFITIPGGDHNSPQSGEYYQALSAFLDRLP